LVRDVIGREGGQPLDNAIRDDMERQLGTDLSSVRIHTSASAVASAQAMRAEAYTVGDEIVFGAGSYSPGTEEGRRTLTHELTHVLQQRGGAVTGRSLPGGIALSDSTDSYEREAAATAARTQRPAGPDSGLALTSATTGAGVGVPRVLNTPRTARAAGRRQTRLSLRRAANAATPTVQRIGERLDKALPAGAPVPAFGEDAGSQRRYSVEQFIALWEQEQGRPLTAAERATLARGCIGITALNVDGRGNPPLDLTYSSFRQAQAVANTMNAAIGAIRPKLPPGLTQPPPGTRAIVFAMLFWSNQAADPAARAAADPHAFKPDRSGRVDMSSYQYLARPGYVNFDYGFWDDATQSFWHANHSQPGMEVYQSTRAKFEAGYADFDRIVYGVAVAHNYDPRKAAVSEALKLAGAAGAARAGAAAGAIASPAGSAGAGAAAAAGGAGPISHP
jgi:hypothetical protein